MYDTHQRLTPAVDRNPVVCQHPRIAVCRYSHYGHHYGFHQQYHDILQWRGVRAQAPRHSVVHHQPVLCRRLHVHNRVVRHHGQLETFCAVHPGHTDRQRHVPFQGDDAR